MALAPDVNLFLDLLKQGLLNSTLLAVFSFLDEEDPLLALQSIDYVSS